MEDEEKKTPQADTERIEDDPKKIMALVDWLFLGADEDGRRTLPS